MWFYRLIGVVNSMNLKAGAARIREPAGLYHMQKLGDPYLTLSGTQFRVQEGGIWIISTDGKSTYERLIPCNIDSNGKYRVSESERWIVLINDCQELCLILMSQRSVEPPKKYPGRGYKFITADFSFDEKYLFALSEKDKIRKLVIFQLDCKGLHHIRDYRIDLGLHGPREEVTVRDMMLLDMFLEFHTFINIEYETRVPDNHPQQHTTIFEIPHDFSPSEELPLPEVDDEVAKREVQKYFPCCHKSETSPTHTLEEEESPTTFDGIIEILTKNAKNLLEREKALQERYKNVEEQMEELLSPQEIDSLGRIEDCMARAMSLEKRIQRLVNSFRPHVCPCLQFLENMEKLDKTHEYMTAELAEYEVEPDDVTSIARIARLVEKIEKENNK